MQLDRRQVQLDRLLTAHTIDDFRSPIHRLRWFLIDSAFMTFYSCVAGAGREGDALLRELSRLLPGRIIVGFTIMGETSANEALSAMSPQTPGTVREAPHGTGSGRPGREGLMTPWHVAAKWARDGVIIRSPPLERTEGNRCANPACPGHASQLDHCTGWP